MIKHRNCLGQRDFLRGNHHVRQHVIMPLNEEDNVCRIGDTVDRIFDSAQKENVRREKGIPDGIGP